MGQFTMSTDEREAFLAALHVGIISVERPGGPPLVTPVWYRYQPGGAVELTTERTSKKGRLLEQAGRASLCVQREELPYAYVTVEGPVEIGEADRETRVDIASRYLGPEAGAGYVDNVDGGDDILVRLHPERWRTTDYSGLDLGGG